MPFTDMSQIRDVESINLYEELCRSMSEEEAFRRILAGTRDHARAMMKWQEAEEQKEDRDSIYYFYKKLIALRKNIRPSFTEKSELPTIPGKICSPGSGSLTERSFT